MQSEIPKELSTSVLTEQVDDIVASLDGNLARHPLIERWLAPICAVSPYLARVAKQYPEAVCRLLREEELTNNRDQISTEHCLSELYADYQSAIENRPVPVADQRQKEALQQSIIRQFRHRQMFRILWRDLSNIATLYDTLEDLSILADACVIAADQWAYEALTTRYGTPQNEQGEEQRLIILGMGKLGGAELNVSSDIDLICLWPEAGKTTGADSGRGVEDNSEFFRRSVQILTKLLNSPTVDGFAFRVDTRLRPFGESGPLVMNFDGLENYYLTQARDWERYAMIKARPITGLADHLQTLQELITPFVYRRYLDYNAFDSLRELKRKIAVSVHQKGMVDNIKLGAGGIREVEFIGQAFQLVRGGREEQLRKRSIVAVLHQLSEDNLLERSEVESLLAAYAYLRRVENAIQMMRDEQAHSLPTDPLDQLRLVTMLDENDWSGFRDTLSKHQNIVSHSFSGLFELESNEATLDPANVEPGTTASRSLSEATSVWTMLGKEDVGDEARRGGLESLGFSVSDELLSVVDSVSNGAFFHRLTADSQERVTRIAPLIIELARATKDPTETLNRCMALVRTVAGRSGYIQVLCDQPQALFRLVSLFSQSRWLANFVVRQPVVIDELLEGPKSEILQDKQAVLHQTYQQLERIQQDDLDVQMDSLRQYRQAREMRIACAQLDGTLTLMQVSDQLSWLAESIIDTVVQLVEQPLREKHGEPQYRLGDERYTSQAAIIAYGKLGGLELGFGSDLDLVFLHDSVGEQQFTNGDKPIANSVYYARLAQKFVHFMGTSTPSGILYEIDMRLRPNGISGVLVTGFDAFAKYQEGDAWTWEHQALIRTRLVYGAEPLRTRYEHIRSQILTQSRSDQQLRQDVAKMREKMRSVLGNSLEGQLNLKQDAGGVADIEFIVQYLVLAYSSEHPELLSFTDNVRLLDVIEAKALIRPVYAQNLCSAYLKLRERLHHQALQELPGVVPLDPELAELTGNVSHIRREILG